MNLAGPVQLLQREQLGRLGGREQSREERRKVKLMSSWLGIGRENVLGLGQLVNLQGSSRHM